MIVGSGTTFWLNGNMLEAYQDNRDHMRSNAVPTGLGNDLENIKRTYNSQREISIPFSDAFDGVEDVWNIEIKGYGYKWYSDGEDSVTFQYGIPSYTGSLEYGGSTKLYIKIMYY